MSEILSANEAATRLQIHLVTLYRWVSEGKLVAERLNKRARNITLIIDSILLML